MIRFGPAGIPLECPGSGTLDGIKYCAEIKLSAMEMEFVHGVRMKDDSAAQVNKTAKELGISLSSHAPYYINLCTDDPTKLANTKRHIFEAGRVTALAGGSITVFHPGFYQKLSQKEAFDEAKKKSQIYC